MKDTNSEYDESPQLTRYKSFHYMLTLDSRGRIIGGRFNGGSARIEMLWVPRRPKASGAVGNEPGNPYISVESILAIWRDSVPADDRANWAVVDPHPLDRLLDADGADSLIPLQRVASAPRVSAERVAERGSSETDAPTTVSEWPTNSPPLLRPPRASGRVRLSDWD
jgi:hypothetical protein